LEFVLLKVDKWGRHEEVLENIHKGA